jgi:hypothetical protein
MEDTQGKGQKNGIISNQRFDIESGTLEKLRHAE